MVVTSDRESAPAESVGNYAYQKAPNVELLNTSGPLLPLPISQHIEASIQHSLSETHFFGNQVVHWVFVSWILMAY